MKINSQIKSSTIKINTESSLSTVLRVNLICLKVKMDNLALDETAFRCDVTNISVLDECAVKGDMFRNEFGKLGKSAFLHQAPQTELKMFLIQI